MFELQVVGQTDVRDQLHGDGQGDRGPTVLPPDQRSADQGHLAAPEEGHGTRPCHSYHVSSGE